MMREDFSQRKTYTYMCKKLKVNRINNIHIVYIMNTTCILIHCIVHVHTNNCDKHHCIWYVAIILKLCVNYVIFFSYENILHIKISVIVCYSIFVIRRGRHTPEIAL